MQTEQPITKTLHVTDRRLVKTDYRPLKVTAKNETEFNRFVHSLEKVYLIKGGRA